MPNSKTLALAALSLALTGSFVSPPATASTARGWEEQAWRTGFLANHSRFLMVVDIQDEKGQKARVMTMRGFTNTHVDGVFIAPVGADGQATGEWFRGYSQTASGSRLIVDGDMKDFPGDSFSTEQWWMEQGPATSFAQWWAMALAVPQQPRSGGCRFASHEHKTSKAQVWLPSACTMEDPVTGRPIKLEWSGWRAATEDNSNWQFWVPGLAKLSVEGKRYTIELRNLQMRPAHDAEPNWPLSLVPQACSLPKAPGAPLDEVPVPLEQLDYHKWKAD